MADPFADLIPQGGSEQGGTIDLPASPRPTPVTQYSIPRRVLGGSCMILEQPEELGHLKMS